MIVRMSDEKTILKQYFGFTGFRESQQELISAVLSGRDVLGIMPTGAGKSLCYQIPSLMLPGLTLVFSPLISLMKDQVMALKIAGAHPAYLNSTLTPGQQSIVLSRAADGQYNIMYVAPERLASPAFQAFAGSADIPLVTIDEAHCVSQWGHQFRPDYLQIREFIAGLPKRPVVSAFTATATAEVRADIIKELGLIDPLVKINGFDRANLYFDVEHTEDKKEALLRIVRANAGKSGIVYCGTRKNVDEVADFLSKHGISAGRYHAGMADNERSAAQENFVYDRAQVMVATNAFGMGIDKSDVAFVVHYNMPKDLESYYQEAGRAGRDGSPAQCILLYSGADVRLNEFLITKSLEENTELTEKQRESQLEVQLERLKQMTFYSTTNDCLRHFILNYFGEASPAGCGRCGNCLKSFETFNALPEARLIIACIQELAQSHRTVGRKMIADILHGSRNAALMNSDFQNLSAYNQLSDHSEERIIKLIDALIEQGYVIRTAEKYPVLLLDKSAETLLAEDAVFQVHLPKEKKSSAAPAGKSRSVRSGVEISDLFSALKQLRLDIAHEENVPAYIIFPDSVLREMSERRPAYPYELEEIRGVGSYKLEKYGSRFLKLIRSFES